MKRIRRINFYSGPGTGKSTTAAFIFASLKKKIIEENINIQVEHTTEYVKNWAWEGKKPTGFDQFYICAKQLRREEIPLRNGVDVIVTDSPLLMQCCYAKTYHVPCWENLVEITNKFEEQYNGLHIFLERGNRRYMQGGRFDTEDEAKAMDKQILNFLNQYLPSTYTSLPSEDVATILDYCLKEIGIENKINASKEQNFFTNL